MSGTPYDGGGIARTCVDASSVSDELRRSTAQRLRELRAGG